MAGPPRRALVAIISAGAVLLPSCGIILGSQGASDQARRDLAPPEQFDEPPNPLTGDGGTGDRAETARQREKREKRERDRLLGKDDDSTTTTTPYPTEGPASLAPGVVLLQPRPNTESGIWIGDPAAIPGLGTKPADPDAPSPPEPTPTPEANTPYCRAMVSMITAGTRLFRDYWDGDAKAQRNMVNDFHAGLRSMAGVVSEELALLIGGAVTAFDDAMAAGLDGSNPNQVARLIAPLATVFGDVLTPVLTDAARRCLPNDPTPLGTVTKIKASITAEEVYAYFRTAP